MQKLRTIEMLRAIAALLVVMFHAQGLFGLRTGKTPFGGLFVSGYRGVDLFFVISGFIIAHVHARDVGRPWRLANYAFNRAARIYPAVWIMTLFAASLYAVGYGGADKADKLAGWSVTASLLLLPQVGDALVSVTWSLKYEMFFYVVFAVLIVNQRAGLVVLGLWQAAVLVVSAAWPTEPLGMEGYYLRSLCLEFSVGIACAWCVGRPLLVARMHLAVGQWLLLALGLSGFGYGLYIAEYADWAGVPCALGAGAIIVALILLEQSGRIRVPQGLVVLGGASYSIYLVHFSVITVLAMALAHARAIPLSNAVFLAGAAISVAAGVAFDRFIDQPIQRALRRRLKPALLGMNRQTTSPLP